MGMHLQNGHHVLFRTSLVTTIKITGEQPALKVSSYFTSILNIQVIFQYNQFWMYIFITDWDAYCGDACPDGSCPSWIGSLAQTLCSDGAAGRYGGCKGKYKSSHFDRYCKKTCGVCKSSGSKPGNRENTHIHYISGDI